MPTDDFDRLLEHACRRARAHLDSAGHRPPRSQASAAALRASTESLGEAGKLLVVGDRATLTLTDAAGDEVQAWLQEAREGARARPVEVRLTRNAQGNFDGNLVVALPGAAP